MRIKYVIMVCVTALALTGCGLNDENASSGDLKGIPAAKPDKIRAFNNIDGHPNIVELCISNRAFLTTSRTAGSNFTRFPDDDVAFCGAKSESKYMPTVQNPTNDQPVPAPSAS